MIPAMATLVCAQIDILEAIQVPKKDSEEGEGNNFHSPQTLEEARDCVEVVGGQRYFGQGVAVGGMLIRRISYIQTPVELK
jgi:hypothetical protein